MSRRPLILDLFCCEGGAGQGYHDAGFDVVGVDLNQAALRRYPFPYFPGDALAMLPQLVDTLKPAAIHASPPCQAYSITKHSHSTEHPDLIPATRAALRATGLPYVIENVPGAPMLDAVTLCGASFNMTGLDKDGTRLVLRRHRLFESNMWLWGQECMCKRFRDRGYQVAGVYGGGSTDRRHAKDVRRGGYTPSKAIQETLLGVPWMTQKGLNQCIPPAYTRYLGAQLLDQITQEATA